MLQTRLSQRALPNTAWGFAILLCAGHAGAAPHAGATPHASAKEKDTKHACQPAFAAYKLASAEFKAHHLHESKSQLQGCMQSSCGGVAHSCKVLHDKIMAALPTVVPIVTDESGAPRSDVRVSVDGVLLASKLDGTGLPVEPGVHEFSFSTDSGVAATRKLMVIEGWRNWSFSVPIHALSAVAQKPLEAPAATPTPHPEITADKPKTVAVAPNAVAVTPVSRESADREPSHDVAAAGRWTPPRSALPYVLGGVVGLGAGALFTHWGHKDNSALESQCSPNCQPASLDHVRGMYVAADISLGIGVAALGVATWLFASSRSVEVPETKAATSLYVHTLPAGAFATIARTF